MSDVQDDAALAAAIEKADADVAKRLDLKVANIAIYLHLNVELAKSSEDETEVDYALRLMPQIRDAAAKRIWEAESARDTAMTELASMTAERDTLQAAADKAAAAPKVARASAGGKARKCGPLQNPYAAGLLEAIAAAETVEVLFSDGKLELAAIPALVVSGTVWAKVIGGVALRVPELLIHGPAVGGSPWPLAGYGLFLDGKQFAWASRSDTLLIGGGMQMNLRDDVIFPAE